MSDILKYDDVEMTAAYKWWKEQHPECINPRRVHHGWYGHCVFALFQFERQCVALIPDIIKEYRETVTNA